MVLELDARRLASAATLSAVAGAVDAIAFIAIGGYFVSFMSGNTTRGAVDATTGGKWWIAVVLVAAFVAGVALASVAQRTVARRPAALALVIVAALLSLAAAGSVLLPVLAVTALLAGAMGAVNVAYARNHTVSFGVTYMTGALVKAAQGAIGALWGERGTGWWRYLVLWGAIVVGAIAGAAGYLAVGALALWGAVLAVLVVLGVTLVRRD